MIQLQTALFRIRAAAVSFAGEQWTRPGDPHRQALLPYSGFFMISEMREKLSREVDQLSHELNVLLPQAIAQAVELGDLRENSEYKAALERQQFVQARLGQLHQRLNQLGQLANHEAPTDRVGLGSTVTVLDLETKETDVYIVVLAEMMDIDAGHISLASPLGRALANGRVGDELSLRLPTTTRRLRITDLVTVHQAEGSRKQA
jgi:transcription elongation factor GreA